MEIQRDQSVAMTSPVAGTQSYTYAHNSEGLRWKITHEDNRYWQFGYNDRGEVTSGATKLPRDAVALGYQFGYSFDAIGNRLPKGPIIVIIFQA